MESGFTLGIDLGTTNSVMAIMQDGSPTVLRNRAGLYLTPSVVAVTRSGKRIVGSVAKRQAVTNAESTAYATKRLIGRKWSSPQAQEAKLRLPYKLSEGEHDDIRVTLQDCAFSLPEVSALILAEMKADAEKALDAPLKKAVITVPAHFNDAQRQATRDAGAIAGLDVIRIINEPTAAALAFGQGRSLSGNIAVFDLGGGTFDMTVLELNGPVYEVLATGGDSFLGGEDIDNLIIEWLAKEFEGEHGVNPRVNPMANQRLKDAAERAKCELSSVMETRIDLPFLISPASGGSAVHLGRVLTREKLEEMAAPLVERCIEKSRATLAEAKLASSDIREVILVGGMTRMPLVGERVRSFFGREPSRGVHPDEAVALGAAIQAAIMEQEESDVILLDVTPHSLGVAIVGGYTRTILQKNTTVPTSATELFSTSKDNQDTVRIMVLQGESPVAAENELLGEFLLTGLEKAMRGEVQVEVTFDINADGILSVSGRDVATGKSQFITVTASGGLTREELRGIIEGQQEELLAEASAEGPAKVAAEVQALAKELLSRLGAASAGVRPGAMHELVERAKKVAAGSDAAPMLGVRVELVRALAALESLPPNR